LILAVSTQSLGATTPGNATILIQQSQTTRVHVRGAIISEKAEVSGKLFKANHC
jgi:hypothetical protein